MHGMRAAWNRKYLEVGDSEQVEEVQTGTGADAVTYKAYQAPRRLCSFRCQNSLMLVMVALASARHFSKARTLSGESSGRRSRACRARRMTNGRYMMIRRFLYRQFMTACARAYFGGTRLVEEK